MPCAKKITTVEEYFRTEAECFCSYRYWPKRSAASKKKLAEALFMCEDAKKQLCQCVLCGKRIDVTEGNVCILKHHNESPDVCQSPCQRFSSYSEQNGGSDDCGTRSATRHHVATTRSSLASICCDTDDILRDEQSGSGDSSDPSRSSSTLIYSRSDEQASVIPLGASESDSEETEVLKAAGSSDQLGDETRDLLGFLTAYEHLRLPAAGSLDEVVQIDPLRTNLSTIETDGSVPDRLKCLICWEREKRVCFLHCGHLCCCSRCAVLFENCPVCGNFITDHVNTYLV